MATTTRARPAERRLRRQPRQPASTSASSWLDSDGFPDADRLDDTDRGYENLSANMQVRTRLGAAQLALRHWRTEGTSEYSDFFLTPVDQDFETSTTVGGRAFPVARAATHA